MPTIRIPLVGSLTNRNDRPPSTKDQQFINCFPEVVRNPITGQGKVYLNKRTGFSFSSTFVSGGVGSYGSVLWTGNSAAISPPVVSFYDSGFSRTSVWDAQGSGTQIGGNIANTNACLSLSETMVSTTSNLVGYFVDSGTSLIEAWFFPQGGAWTQITDADFPPNIGTPEPLATASGPVHMDGYMFVMTNNGKIWNSDINSVSAWTASSYITAQASPDGGMGLARYRNLIVAFGKNSVEFFENRGNATGSPLSSIPSATIRVGCVQFNKVYRSILNVGDTVYWIGVETGSHRIGIYRLNGYQAEKVSTPFIDKILNDNSQNLILGFAGAMTMHGQTHIYMFSGSLNYSYVFCPDTNIWWINLTLDNQQPLSIVGSNISDTSSGLYSYYVNNQNAQVASTLQGSFTDDAQAYTMTVRTDNIDHGTMNRKFYERIRVVGDIQSSASNISISFSDDDFATFSTARTIDMSSHSAMAMGLTRLGSARRRSWKLEHSANTPCRLEAIEIGYVKGSF